MASMQLTQFQSSSTMKTASEETPRQSVRASLHNGGTIQLAGPLQSTKDFRIGENFSHLKLTADKMLHERACIKSDIQILNTKLRKSEETVRTLETKVQDMNNENAVLKLKHKHDMKLWKELDSKFLATTTLCDQLAETLQFLDCQVQEAERSKTFLEEKLAAEKLKFFEDMTSQVNDLLHKKEVAVVSLGQCEASNANLQRTLQELEQNLVSESIRFQQVAVEKDDLQQQLANAMKKNEDDTAAIRSIGCEIQDLQKLIQERLAYMENDLKERQRQFELQLEVKETEHSKHLQEISQRNIEEITDMRRKYEDETREATVKERLKGEAALQAVRQTHDESMAKELEAFNRRLNDVLENHDHLISKIREECKKEKANMAILNAELHIKHEELHAEKEKGEAALRAVTQALEVRLAKELEAFNRGLNNVKENHDHLIRKLQEGCEQEKAKMATLHAEELHIKHEELHAEKEKGEASLRTVRQVLEESMAKELEAFNRRLNDLQENHDHLIRKLQEGCEQEKAKMTTLHAEELQLKHEELHAEKEKGEASLRAVRQALEESMAKELEAFNRRLKDLQDNHDHLISKLQEGCEQEKTKMDILHAEKLRIRQAELHAESKEKISKLREKCEQEMAKMSRLHAEELDVKHKELHTEKEKEEAALRAVRQSIEIMTKELEAFGQRLLDEQENNDNISELREAHEEEKAKTATLHAKELDVKQKELDSEKEKGKAALQALDDNMAKELEAFNRQMRNVQEDHDHVISNLRQGYEQEKSNLATLHNEELHVKDVELRAEKEKQSDKIAKVHNFQLEIKEIQKSHQEERENFQEDYQDLLLKVKTVESSSREEISKIKLAHEEELAKKSQDQKTQCDRLERDKQVHIRSLQKSLNQDIEEWRSKAFWFETKWKEVTLKTAANEISKEDKQTQIANEDFTTTKEALFCNEFRPPNVRQITEDKEPAQQSQRSGKRKLDLLIKDCSPQVTQKMNYQTSISMRKMQDTRDIQDISKVSLKQQRQTSPDLEVLTITAEGGFPNDKKTASLTEDVEPLQLQQKSIISPQTVESYQKKTLVTSSYTHQALGLLLLPDPPSHQKRTVVRTGQMHKEVTHKASQANASAADPHTHGGILQKIQSRPDACSNQGRITVEYGNTFTEKANQVSTPNQKGNRREMQLSALPSDGKTNALKRRLRSTKPITHEVSPEGQKLTKKSTSKKGKFFTSENLASINQKTPAKSHSPADLSDNDGLVSYYKGDDPYAFS